jgi:hypothetical protein
MNDSNDPRISLTGRSSIKGDHRLSSKMLITRNSCEVLSENSENLSEVDEELIFKNFCGKLDQHFISETIDQLPENDQYHRSILPKKICSEKTRMPMIGL